MSVQARGDQAAAANQSPNKNPAIAGRIRQFSTLKNTHGPRLLDAGHQTNQPPPNQPPTTGYTSSEWNGGEAWRRFGSAESEVANGGVGRPNRWAEVRPAETATEDFGRKSGRHRRAVFRPADSAGRTAGRWSRRPKCRLVPIHPTPHVPLEKANPPPVAP